MTVSCGARKRSVGILRPLVRMLWGLCTMRLWYMYWSELGERDENGTFGSLGHLPWLLVSHNLRICYPYQPLTDSPPSTSTCWSHQHHGLALGLAGLGWGQRDLETSFSSAEAALEVPEVLCTSSAGFARLECNRKLWCSKTGLGMITSSP